MLFVIVMFLQQDRSPQNPNTYPQLVCIHAQKSLPSIHKAFMSSDCRGTSILVDIEEQRTHLFSCLKQLENRRDKLKSSFLHQMSSSREWIPEAGSKQGEFYNCPNSINSFQQIHGRAIQAETHSLPKKTDLRLQIVRVHRRELHTEKCASVQVIPFQFSAESQQYWSGLQGTILESQIAASLMVSPPTSMEITHNPHDISMALKTILPYQWGIVNLV